MISGDNGIEVDMTMDYRYFLMDNRNYYDELSTMSLLYANSIYQKADNQPEHSGIEIIDENNTEVNKNLQVKKMMEFFGFKDVKTYYLGEEGSENSDGSDYCRNYKDTHKSKVAIGYKNIEYHGIEKTVVGIVIRGTSEDDDWDSDFDMGDLELRDLLLEDYEGGHDKHLENQPKILDDLKEGLLDYDKKYANELLHFAGGYPDWTHKYHHAGFDIVANRVMEILEEYMDENHDMNINICYWVTGHSMGAGVANLVGAELLHGYSGINNRTDNVYCYTFASPNTFYLTDNTNIRQNIAIPNAEVIETYREPHGIKYRCIFNIVNDDDFVPKLPMEECEWTRYGRTAKLSIEKDIKPLLNNSIIRNQINDNSIYYYLLYIYKSNYNKIEKIVEEMCDVYDNTNDMRADTYDFDKDSSYKTILSLYDALVTNDYTKPYQKTFNESYTIMQLQVPEYFLQSIAYAKHSGLFNTAIFKTKRFASKYISAKNRIIDCAAPWAGKIMEYPYYLESYFSLTKEIDVIDFR